MTEQNGARPRVVLVTAVWRRYDVTNAFWLWARWLRERWAPAIDLRFVAALSDITHEALAKVHGVDYVIRDNTPLGAKFNAALARARAHDPSHILIMGSDDFFSAEVADELARAVLEDALSVGLKDLYFADLASGALGYWSGYRVGHRVEEPAGCGRIIARRALEAVNWTLWDPAKTRGMDHSSFYTLKTAGIWPPRLISVQKLDGFAVDVKSGTNLWGYEMIGAKPVIPGEGHRLWEKFPEPARAALALMVTELPTGNGR